MGCNFNLIGTSNEAFFYNDLLAVRKGKVAIIYVINKDDYNSVLNGKETRIDYFRKVKLVLPS